MVKVPVRPICMNMLIKIEIKQGVRSFLVKTDNSDIPAISSFVSSYLVTFYTLSIFGKRKILRVKAAA